MADCARTKADGYARSGVNVMPPLVLATDADAAARLTEEGAPCAAPIIKRCPFVKRFRWVCRDA